MDKGWVKSLFLLVFAVVIGVGFYLYSTLYSTIQDLKAEIVLLESSVQTQNSTQTENSLRINIIENRVQTIEFNYINQNSLENNNTVLLDIIDLKMEALKIEILEELQ